MGRVPVLGNAEGVPPAIRCLRLLSPRNQKYRSESARFGEVPGILICHVLFWLSRCTACTPSMGINEQGYGSRYGPLLLDSLCRQVTMPFARTAPIVKTQKSDGSACALAGHPPHSSGLKTTVSRANGSLMPVGRIERRNVT